MTIFGGINSFIPLAYAPVRLGSILPAFTHHLVDLSNQLSEETVGSLSYLQNL